MRSITKILVAIKDPRARSLPAVAKAVQLARAWGAAIELFHAIDFPVFAGLPGLQGDLGQIERSTRDRSERSLQRIADRIRSSRLKVTVSARWDYPDYEAVIRRAQRVGAGLIVAECHRGRHVAPRLLRMTDWELLRLSPIPVLIVKDPRPYRRAAVLAAVDPTHAFAKPAALDTQLLRLGAQVSFALRGPLHVVHAYMPVPVGLPPYAWRSTRDLTAQIEAQAKSRAQSAFEQLLRGSRIPPARRHLVERHPVDAIPAVVHETRAAMVMMGAVSRSGLKRVFVGNTAEQVLDRLPCDLLVVKPRGFAARVPRVARGMRPGAVFPPA